jgi:hypothetical protein
MGAQMVIDLLDAFLRLSLLCQRPAVQHRTHRDPERKSLVCGAPEGGSSPRLRQTHLATELMEDGSMRQGK